MKRIILSIMLGLICSVAQAVDVVGQRYIDQMTKGGITSIKQAAQSIYNTGEGNTKVLDVAAEVLIQRHLTTSKGDFDTLAWVAKAIGKSRNGRYHSILKTVVDSEAHGKIRKYAKRALNEIGEASGKQYKKGSVNLAKLRKSKSKKSKSARKGSGNQKLSVIREGMSMGDVFDLVGQPTATTQHQTGKAWIPFNFGAKDVVRSVALYKGKGRVVFSHSGHNVASGKVLEVVIDPQESGYP